MPVDTKGPNTDQNRSGTSGAGTWTKDAVRAHDPGLEADPAELDGDLHAAVEPQPRDLLVSPGGA